MSAANCTRVPLVLFLLLLLPLSAHAGILSRPANQLGLVGYWPLDEGSGSTAYDRSGFRDNGTLVNSPTWITGQLNRALNFNGTNQYVNIGAFSYSIPKTAPFSGSAWIKTTVSDRYILSDWNDLVSPGWGFFTSGPYISMFLIGTAGGEGRWRTATKTTVTDGKWHFVSFTYDGSNTAAGISLYVDGSLETMTTTLDTDPGILIAGVLRIATRGDGTVPFNGTIDDVRIYNRTLSQADVTALYNLGAAKLGTATRNASPTTLLINGLVGYWPFDGKYLNWGSNTTADASGNGNTGTLVNMSTSTSGTIGKIGQALSFNGTNQYISIPPISIPTNVTMSAWVYSSNFSQHGLIIQKQPVNTQFQLFFDTNPGGSSPGIYVHGGGNDASCQTLAHSPALPTNNQWHLVTATIAGTVCNIYVDGSVWTTGTVTAIGNGTTPTTNNILISTYDGVNYPFNGKIDEVRIYSRALSATEVQELYQAGGGVTQDASNPQVLTGGGLVGHWSFDGKNMNWATGQALDTSGGGNNGSLVSMSTTTSPVIGKIGQALKFNGSNQYISIPDTAALELSGSKYSVSAWVKPLSLHDYGQVLLKYFSNSPAYGLITLANGQWDWQLFGVSDMTTPAGSLQNNVWAFLTATYDGTNVRLYQNGAPVTTTPESGVSANTGLLLIGSDTINNRYFNGIIDDVRIYSRALTAQEVTTLYDQGR